MNKFLASIFLLAAAVTTIEAAAQEKHAPLTAPDTRVLDKEQWKQLDDSVKRGLTWLAKQQNADGSFESIDLGQPGVTSLCVMAFLAQGESPVDGKYKQQIADAIDYIANEQKPNGLIAHSAPLGVPIPRKYVSGTVTGDGLIGRVAVYNHAISALALSETYGQCSPEQSQKLTPVIEKAIAATLEMQQWDEQDPQDAGGWRYLNRHGKHDSDLSVSGWQLMFLRSAKNAGFDVPQESVDKAVKYIESCYHINENRKVHGYLVGNTRACTRAMAGAGVLAMAHAGKHGSDAAIGSGKWILAHDFKEYNGTKRAYNDHGLPDRYHYGAVLCAQAMYQLGGEFWKKFYPPLVDTLLANQQDDGSWPHEQTEKLYGNCYSTALSILSLSVTNEMLPIFQR